MKINPEFKCINKKAWNKYVKENSKEDYGLHCVYYAKAYAMWFEAYMKIYGWKNLMEIPE